MRVIIAGSRTLHKYKFVRNAMERFSYPVSEVISGCAKGVDKLGIQWAKNNGIPVRRFPADWNRYGKKAGYIRNEEMAQCADALVAVWDGKSRGTAHMIGIAKRMRLHVLICKYNASPKAFLK